MEETRERPETKSDELAQRATQYRASSPEGCVDLSDGEGNVEISIVRSGEAVWEESARSPEETDPPGRECTAFEVAGFSAGLWERDLQRRPFVRTHHEVALIVEGEVEVTLDDGRVLRAGPGDVLVTPKGSKGYWKSLSPVRKFWAILE